MASFSGDELSTIYNSNFPFVHNNPSRPLDISFANNTITELHEVNNTVEDFPFVHPSSSSSSMPDRSEELSRRKRTLDLLGPSDIDRKGKEPEQAEKRVKQSSLQESHNLCEKRRRDRIKERMNLLGRIVPNCNTTNEVSILNDVATHIIRLKQYVNTMTMWSEAYDRMDPALRTRIQLMNSGASFRYVPPRTFPEGTSGFRSNMGESSLRNTPTNVVGFYPQAPMFNESYQSQPGPNFREREQQCKESKF